MEINKIYNEDCLETMKRMPDKSVDLVLTDPPYGINYDITQNKQAESGRVSNGGKWKKYELTNWDKAIPSNEYFDEMLRVSKNQIIFGGNYFDLPKHSTWIIWNKIQRGFMTDGEMAWTSFDKSIYIFDMARSDAYINSGEYKFHPTQKPTELMKWCLDKFSKEGDTIYDPFAGSGTTGVACKMLGRNYILNEISPEYCKIAEDRIKSISNPLF